MRRIIGSQFALTLCADSDT